MRATLNGLVVVLAVAAPLSPSRAFEVAAGHCRQILSGDARVAIHYASGLKAEVDPVDPDNIVTQVDADGTVTSSSSTSCAALLAAGQAVNIAAARIDRSRPRRVAQTLQANFASESDGRRRCGGDHR
jgi:hypothetical protein